MQVFRKSFPQLRDQGFHLSPPRAAIPSQAFRPLCDNGAGGGRLVLPGRGQDADGLVVAGETVDTRLDKNEAELGVLVLAVALEVLADSDGLWHIALVQALCQRRGPSGRG